MTEIIHINKVIQVVKVTSPKIQVATIGTQGPPGTGGDVTHGALNGLENDDHPQYHNDARGMPVITPSRRWMQGLPESQTPDTATR
jgi:hypothetical protein